MNSIKSDKLINGVLWKENLKKTCEEYAWKKASAWNLKQDHVKLNKIVNV